MKRETPPVRYVSLYRPSEKMNCEPRFEATASVPLSSDARLGPTIVQRIANTQKRMRENVREYSREENMIKNQQNQYPKKRKHLERFSEVVKKKQLKAEKEPMHQGAFLV